MAAVTSKVAILTIQSPRIPLKTIVTIDEIAADAMCPESLRYFAACVIYTTIASYRFKNTVRITDMRYDVNSISSTCAPSGKSKSPPKWAIPAAGFETEGVRVGIILEVRKRRHS